MYRETVDLLPGLQELGLLLIESEQNESDVSTNDCADLTANKRQIVEHIM